MPENKPMKMQWLTVDGRQVPSILPNHWNEQKNDWDITGTKNPLPIANYTQNASGVWLPTSESNPVPTRLTGSIAEILPRQIRNSDSNFMILERPSWAKGGIISATIYGVTGTFAENQGINLMVALRGNVNNPGDTGRLSTGKTTTSPMHHTVFIYPSISNGDLNTITYRRHIGLPLTKSFWVHLGVNGTFQSGEGFDCDVSIEWLP